MFSKAVVLLAAAGLATQVLGAAHHRHAHQRMHEKRDPVTHTEYTTVTDWVTVVVTEGDEPTSSLKFMAANHTRHAHTSTLSTLTTTSSTSTSTTSSSEIPTSTSTTSTSELPAFTAPEAKPVVPSTPAAEPAPVSTPAPVVQVSVGVSVGNPAPAPSSSSAPVSTPPTSGGGNKRGLVYNDPSLLSGFLGAGNKIKFAYNWGQSNDLPAGTGLNFAPMMWGPNQYHIPGWANNAEKAIANGATVFLSFNECDNAGQANLSPYDAAVAHVKYLNPYQGRVRIATPAITNSGAKGQGIDWLAQFVAECKKLPEPCAYDITAFHWYSPPNAKEFLQHVTDVYNTLPLPLWLTEFAPSGSDSDINSFLQTVLPALDADSRVEAYFYFMVTQNSLISSGKTPSSYGNTYAYS